MHNQKSTRRPYKTCFFYVKQEDGCKKYGKSKEHRPNPIIQMGLFMDGDGIPLAFSLFPGNANEQSSLKPLEKKILSDFECQKFIYCSDAGLGSESIREFNHMGERSYIVTQSIKKLVKEEREWALNKQGFKKVSDNTPVDITKLSPDDTGLYYKDEPYTTKKLQQRLTITYSPKYALYQKAIRDKQVERAQQMLNTGTAKKNRKNPNDPARFIGTMAITKEGEAADIKSFLDENRIRAHFLICFLALTIYRFLERKLNFKYTCEELLDTLKSMNFAEIQEQGFIPLYSRSVITDDLHNACGFRTDSQFLTKSKMRTIQKKSKGKE